MNYVPLHIYTGYSFLSSSLKIDDLMNVALKNGYKKMGISDINNVYAYPSFYHSSIKNNLTPIFGITLFPSYFNNKIKICLYINNEAGYLKLCKIISNVDNLRLEDLLKDSSGLKAIIPFKENSYLWDLFLNDNDAFSSLILKIDHAFDEIYFGVEIYSPQDNLDAKLIRTYAFDHSYKTIAFPKHLYLTKHDALTIKILDAIKNENNIDTFIEEDGPYYFLSEKALNQLYTKEEIDNTSKICDSITFNFLTKRGNLLKYDLNSTLNHRKLILFRCQKKIKDNHLENNDIYQNRLNEELDVIEKMGYLDYFLIVADYVSYAKSHHIPVGPGRGSACGSLVSYLLDITDVDPLKFNLFFERFLNPGRVTMPDIDIDIADYARNDIINYLFNKYGNNRAALITTFQTFASKQAIRDIGRVFSINNSDINTLCSLIKKDDETILEAINNNKSLASLASDPYFNKILNAAMKLEGLPRQPGLHAAGIVLNNDPLFNVIPLSHRQDNLYVIEYEKDYLEEQGFLKMDILGLKNLSIISTITSLINPYRYKDNPYLIPLDDQKTYSLLNKGFNQGIFQLESEGMNASIKKIQLNQFNDLVALLALYRPGPMDFINTYSARKNNNLKVEYIHPSLEPILKETYGIIVYQEQIMQIVRTFAHYSYSEADLFRRAISKKDNNKLIALKDEFISSSIKNGYQEEDAQKVFDLIEKFASYGFNKSHSVAYSLISYNLAYLKANYPLEFYSVLLSYSSIGDSKFNKLLKEMKSFDITLSLPSINESKEYYVIKKSSLIMPFNAIKGLPTNIIEAIINEQEKSPFTSLNDFVRRMYEYKITIYHVSLLIYAGAFDSFNVNRNTLINNLKTIFEYESSSYQSVSLLSKEELALMEPIIRKYPDNTSLNYQKEIETIGMLISGSFFERYLLTLQKHHAISISNAIKTNSTITISFIIKDYRTFRTKKNEMMASLNVFDDSLDTRVVLFPRTYENYKNILNTNSVYLATGYFKKEERYDEVSFILNTLEELKEDK